MTTYTITDNGTRSTSRLDAMLEDAKEMKTVDACGRPSTILLAEQAKAFGNAFEMRHREFGDGNGMAGEWFHKAANYYKQHADEMMETARRCWKTL